MTFSIIFPMAGLSSRFSRAGYKKEKFFLKIGKFSMFRTVLKSFTSSTATRFVFIVKKNFHNFDFIEQTISELYRNRVSIKIYRLSRDTNGQAQTVDDFLKDYPINNFAVFNIDSFYEPGIELFPVNSRITFDGLLHVFQSYGGEQYSFIKASNDLQDEGFVQKVSEKVKISDLACTGFYFFKSYKNYRDAYLAAQKSGKIFKNGESYIAPLYNEMLFNNLQIAYKVIDNSKFNVVGTPEEYMSYCINNKLEFEAS